MRDMEDAVSLRPSFCTWADGSPMHFFAVFDGHGGPHVSALCREQMHVILAEELAAAAREGEEVVDEERAWRAALSRSFSRVDALAAVACACGRAAVPPCRCPLSGQTGAIIGSTAVVALLVRDRLVVANCGDSRAVLCRAAAAAPLPLSSDHKPDRPDEKARIEAAGGRVVYLNGPRVRGILAMSRALGDRYLKPEVICEPDITITERTVDDECLILASDGMWDVISNETACDVARQCLEDGRPSSAGRAAAGSGEAASSSTGAPAAAVGQESEPRCYRAAALLARLALGRESSDNISVVVIDLQGRG
ncbi:probable protein phosphatase 2C 37 [Oryza brachyantha]|uniref:probable protein phosphatase 2C 37 n=1 Tax=Oryza brachyantha TaxID=4533 RepID=UPI001ADB93DD|nr:probable protein phosphatase 2C 37 [Oryza brachyantha]